MINSHFAAILHDATSHEEAVLREGRERSSTPITDPADPSVPDDVKVWFEGEWVTWGSLTNADRKAYMQGGSFPY